MQTLFPPPSKIIDREGHLVPDWRMFFNLVSRQVFNPISTAAGNVSQALPDAAENFRIEWIFLKTTADVNTVTITGGAAGNVVLSTQYANARFLSDGNGKWYQVG